MELYEGGEIPLADDRANPVRVITQRLIRVPVIRVPGSSSDVRH
jgi:hypothetical protein